MKKETKNGQINLEGKSNSKSKAPVKRFLNPDILNMKVDETSETASEFVPIKEAEKVVDREENY